MVNEGLCENYVYDKILSWYKVNCFLYRIFEFFYIVFNLIFVFGVS